MTKLEADNQQATPHQTCQLTNNKLDQHRRFRINRATFCLEKTVVHHQYAVERVIDFIPVSTATRQATTIRRPVRWAGSDSKLPDRRPLPGPDLRAADIRTSGTASSGENSPRFRSN